MSETQFFIPVDMDKEEVSRLFENFNLNSACVVDNNNKLVGMITSDDILTVLKEEAEEDTLRLAGVGAEKITDGVLRINVPRLDRDGDGKEQKVINVEVA